MATYRPGTKGGTGQEATVWEPEIWKDEADVLAYNQMKLANRLMAYDPLKGKLHVPKHDNLARNTLADSAAGTGLTYSANVETEFTCTPQMIYCAVEVPASTMARLRVDPGNWLKPSIEMTIAEGVDTAVATLISALATWVAGDGSTGFNENIFLDAYEQLVRGAKMYFDPGQNRGKAFCLLPLNQTKQFLQVERITNAQIRGPGEQPIETGMVMNAFGTEFGMCGNLPNSGAGGTAFGVMAISRAGAVSYNTSKNPAVKIQEIELATRFIGAVDFGSGTVRDQYAIPIRLPGF